MLLLNDRVVSTKYLNLVASRSKIRNWFLNTLMHPVLLRDPAYSVLLNVMKEYGNFIDFKRVEFTLKCYLRSAHNHRMWHSRFLHSVITNFFSAKFNYNYHTIKIKPMLFYTKPFWGHCALDRGNRIHYYQIKCYILLGISKY